MYSHTRKLFHIMLATVCLAFLPFSAFAASTDAPTVELYTVDYPPYTIISPDGEISGIDVDVTTAAYAAVGINTVVLTAPWKRTLKNLQHGHIVGIITCSKRPGREEFILFSELLSEVNQVAVMSKETNARKLNVFSDLADFDVMVVDGWGIQDELERSGIKHRLTTELDNGINAVAKRGVDVFYNAELITQYRANQLGFKDKLKYKRFSDIQSTPFYLCLSKKHEKNVQLIEQFNKGLSIIKGNGTYQAIYDRYLR